MVSSKYHLVFDDPLEVIEVDLVDMLRVYTSLSGQGYDLACCVHDLQEGVRVELMGVPILVSDGALSRSVKVLYHVGKGRKDILDRGQE